jgi:DNA-binding CsgD family transcriptional regulator
MATVPANRHTPSGPSVKSGASVIRYEIAPSPRLAAAVIESGAVGCRVCQVADVRTAPSVHSDLDERTRRPRHGWASVTPTEQHVVDLVAEGLTNPKIAERLLMGRGTVKTHLEHVFAKTGLRNRAELAAATIHHKHQHP